MANGEPSARVFSCHACGFMRLPEHNLNETCSACGGWRLEPLGIGIERIEDEVARLFPNLPRFSIDGTRAKTRPQALKILAQFEKEAGLKKVGAVLIGTPAIISILTSVDHTAIISIDSLFAIPDLRINEHIFALLLDLREKTSRTLLVQTRADDTTLITQALEGNLAEFIDEELTLRKAFAYPPFGTIIKITVRDKKEMLPDKITRLKEFLHAYTLISSSACTRENNTFRMHVLLKRNQSEWPDKTLSELLRSLPQEFTIEVNPNHLL